MSTQRSLGSSWAASLLATVAVLAPPGASAHPMGNFSISRYAAIRVGADAIELRYAVDMAEIPTFQQLQDSGMVPEAHDPSVAPYLARQARALAAGLVLELNGRRLPLEASAREILFTPGAGGLPTMKLGMRYRAAYDPSDVHGMLQLAYRDENFAERTGWKEVVADAGPDVVLATSTVPARDRSRELSDYPTDLLNSPPQVTDARVAFACAPTPAVTARTPAPRVTARTPAPGVTARTPDSPVIGRTPDAPVTSRAQPTAPTGTSAASPAARADRPGMPPATDLHAAAGSSAATSAVVPNSASDPGSGTTQVSLGARGALRPNVQARSRDAFTDLIAMPEMSAGLLLFAALVAAALGAVHALEPGHGKTVVAAYLVGSRGTARHALLLGLVVTTSHTAGVYLLGAVTLYASRYVVPDQLYPWLGALSGVMIAGLGIAVFARRAGAHDHGHAHAHAHGAGAHDDEHPRDHHHAHAHSHGHGRHDHHHHGVSLRELLALGITGGIVPCPAALVVLLSAVALRRIGFGLFLIVAFSVGLAAVLIAIGVLMVYARGLMARVHGDGPVISRWLPMASSAVVTLLGVAIAVQALTGAGIVHLKLG